MALMKRFSPVIGIALVGGLLVSGCSQSAPQAGAEESTGPTSSPPGVPAAPRVRPAGAEGDTAPTTAPPGAPEVPRVRPK